jgi:hypothetical protein
MACIYGLNIGTFSPAVAVDCAEIACTVAAEMKRIRICISEEEAVRDFASVLLRVRKDLEIIIRAKGEPVR